MDALVRLSNLTRNLLIVAVVCSAWAQPPLVSDINFYGLRKVTGEKILTATKMRTGGPLPPSKGALEETIAEIPGIVLARVQAVCCDGSDAILFIGVEEKGAPHAAFRS